MHTALSALFTIFISTLMAQGQSASKSDDASTNKSKKITKGADLAARRLAAFSGAYQLDDPQKKWLEGELKMRAVQFDRMEQESDLIQSAIKDAIQAKKDIKELQQRLRDALANDPLKNDVLIPIVDQHVRPEQRVGGQRIRERHKQREKEELEKYNTRTQDQLRENKSIRRSFQAAPQKAPTAPRTEKAVPTGKATVSKAVAGEERPKRDSRNRREFDKRENGGNKTKSTVKPARPSEWPRIVTDAGNRYRFNAAQRATAEGILKDCQRRAEAFRAVHERDLQRITSIIDARVRNQTQQELEAPLAAIEQELRERLDQIPNAEQRAAPAAPRK